MVMFLTIILFVLAVSLITLVLIQPDRSHGMGSSFGGGGASSSIFGVSNDGGTLAKITEFVAGLFVVVAFILYVISTK